MDRVKGMMLTGAAILIFIAGFYVASKIYQSKISDMEAAHALALAEKQKEITANASKQNRALSEAWDAYEKVNTELEKSRADSGSLRTQLERVRVEADRYRKRLSATGANPCKHFAVRLGECVKLLEEGAGLSAEGASLSQRVSGKHDAVVRIHNGAVLK